MGYGGRALYKKLIEVGISRNHREFAVQVSEGGNFINPPDAACGSTSAESMTWGGVKSLFTE